MVSLSESGFPCRRGINTGLVAPLRGDGAVGADGLAAMAVVGLAVVPGVGQEPVEGHKVSFPPWTAVTDTYAETAEFRPKPDSCSPFGRRRMTRLGGGCGSARISTVGLIGQAEMETPRFGPPTPC